MFGINLFKNCSSVTTVLLSLSIILFSGFLITRLTKLVKLPNVSAYIIAGILIGPYFFGLIPKDIVNEMKFVSDIALSFIAFEVGKFFKKDILKEMGAKAVVITLFESLLAGALITFSLHYIFALDWNFSLLLGAVATATAPASTMMTIRQYHARGDFVNTLLQVVALDDVICLMVFSVCTAIIVPAGETITFMSVFLPIIYNIGAIVAGFACGFILSKLMTPTRSNDNRLILVIAMLLSVCGICALIDISPLLSCMVLSATYINLTHDKELYHQIDAFTPPVMSLFFIVSGMNLNLSSLATFGFVGVAYFIIRIIGKYVGAFFGSLTVRMPKNIRNYLGLALVPQAGVAIGLAFLGERMLGPTQGGIFLSIILASSVLYELVGPACAKYALFASGTIKKDKLPKPQPIKTEELQIVEKK